MDGEHEIPSAEGSSEIRYTNLFQIGYNAFEFVLEFGHSYAGDPTLRIHSRIITSPVYAREFLDLLQKSLAAYEKKFGTVQREAQQDGVVEGEEQS
ncbi:MAG TPA: DUF3467 domain-containing protein [Candidatus Acidoferrum sp.]|nr:DUF3467 domain-containing protein [Candidatus Acidoferrum sp.]